MNHELISSKTQSRPQQEWLIYLYSALLITLFLFYIDEGYNNFNWTKDPGNWLAFIIYVVPIYLAQVLLGQVLLGKYGGWGKVILSILLGSALAIYIVVSILTGSWW